MKIKSLTVRPFKQDDKEFVLSLSNRFTNFRLPEWRTDEEIDESTYKTLSKAMDIPDFGTAIFIAEDGAQGRVGFIHLQSYNDYFNGKRHGHISDLAVIESYEGKGAASMLMRKAEEWARGMGYEILTLSVFSRNENARKVYEHLGYEKEIVKYVKMIK